MARKWFELIELVYSGSTCLSGVFLLTIAGFDELVHNRPMKRQSARVELFPLKKEDILAYLDDKEILVNDYFKTYLAHPAYQEVVEK
ncbi:TPA: hypothetical protein TXJ05_001681 [Streptococcus suis]|nr:hypothetical protein SUT286_01360 [Streptococcus parasuis]HEL1557477.1 hypothetical protein [Streptococcus suis]